MPGASSASFALNPLPVRRVQRSAQSTLGEHEWPATLPSVAQLLRDGLDLGPATVLVGENGSGKSTIVEAIAMAFGLGAEGGSTGARNRTWNSESSLHESLALVRGAGPAAGATFCAPRRCTACSRTSAERPQAARIPTSTP